MLANGARRATWTIAVLGLIGIVPFPAATQLHAQTTPDTPDRPPRFGMIGIVRGQTARLNVVYVEPDGPDFPPDPCRIMLQFLDNAGRVQRTSNITLAPGYAGFLDLVRSDAATPTGRVGAQAPDGPDRQQVRAMWVAPDSPDMPQCSHSNFIASVEVFGRDGKTAVFQAPDGGDIPPDGGDRPSSFGMFGVVRGETARLNVVFVAPDGGDLPPGPCRIGLQFLDSQGAVLKTSEISLAPRHAGFLDLVRSQRPSPPGRAGTVEPDVGDRQQIRAVWTAPDGPDMPQCNRSNLVGTIEVFGRDGRTTVLYQTPDVGDTAPDSGDSSGR